MSRDEKNLLAEPVNISETELLRAISSMDPENEAWVNWAMQFMNIPYGTALELRRRLDQRMEMEKRKEEAAAEVEYKQLELIEAQMDYSSNTCRVPSGAKRIELNIDELLEKGQHFALLPDGTKLPVVNLKLDPIPPGTLADDALPIPLEIEAKNTSGKQYVVAADASELKASRRAPSLKDKAAIAEIGYTSDAIEALGENERIEIFQGEHTEGHREKLNAKECVHLCETKGGKRFVHATYSHDHEDADGNKRGVQIRIKDRDIVFEARSIKSEVVTNEAGESKMVITSAQIRAHIHAIEHGDERGHTERPSRQAPKNNINEAVSKPEAKKPASTGEGAGETASAPLLPVMASQRIDTISAKQDGTFVSIRSTITAIAGNLSDLWMGLTGSVKDPIDVPPAGLGGFPPSVGPQQPKPAEHSALDKGSTAPNPR